MSPVRPQRGLADIRPYVPGKPIEEVQREYGLTDIIKLASNENPLGPSPRAMRALAEEVHRIHLYPDGDSYDLRHALARHLGVQPEQVTVGNGADGVIVQTCLAYLDDGDEVIVGRPSFPIYDTYTYVMRARLVPVPLRDYRLDLEGMAAAITDRTKIIFVCNPNNPTGTIVTADEVSAFMARVPDHVLVVFDEAYYEFVHADDFPDTLAYVREGRKNVMTIRTFSKIYGLAGVRLGYAVADPEVLAPLLKVKGALRRQPAGPGGGHRCAGGRRLSGGDNCRYHQRAAVHLSGGPAAGAFLHPQPHQLHPGAGGPPGGGGGPAPAGARHHRPPLRPLRPARVPAHHRGHSETERPPPLRPGGGADRIKWFTTKTQRHEVNY